MRRALSLVAIGWGLSALLAAGSADSARAECTRPALELSDAPTVTVRNIRELDAALGRANQGGELTILLEDGVYELERTIVLRADHITLRGRSGDRDKVVLRGQGMDGRLGHVLQVYGSHITLAHLTVGHVRLHAVQVHAEKDADDFHAYDVRFVDAAEQIIKVSHQRGGPQSDRGLIEWCLFEFSAGHAHQSYTGGLGAIGAKDWIVRDNVFRNIRMPPGVPGNPTAVMFRRASEGTRIERNRIINADSGIRLGLQDGRHGRATVVNNQVHVVRDVGISLERAEGVLVAHNTVWSDSYPNAIEYRFAESKRNRIVNNLLRGVVQGRDQGQATVENNVEHGTEDWFLAPGLGVLGLAAGPSAVVDRALPLTGMDSDVGCDPRPNGLRADIGAEEYAGVVDISASRWADGWLQLVAAVRAAPYRVAYAAADLRRSPRKLAGAGGVGVAILAVLVFWIWRRRARRRGVAGGGVRTAVIILIAMTGLGGLGLFGYLVKQNGVSGALGTVFHRAGGLAQWLIDSALAPEPSEEVASGGITILHRSPGGIMDADTEQHRLRTRLRVEGIGDVRLALRARSLVKGARLVFNAFDLSSMDNISPQTPLWLDTQWRDLLLRPSTFTYNAHRLQLAAPRSSLSSLTWFPDAITGYAQTADVVVYRGDDGEPPSAPSELNAKPTEAGVELTWQMSRDNVAVSRYIVSRATAAGDFVKLAETVEPAYLDAFSGDAARRYRVAAVDPQRNVSPWSEVLAHEASASSAGTKPIPNPPWFQSNVRAIHRAGHGKADRERLLLFGDSLTGARNYALEIEAALGRYQVVAIGQAGARTHQGLARLPAVLDEYRPGLVLILFGTNNPKNTPDEIARGVSDLRQMVTVAKQRGVIPIVGTIPPRGFTDPNSTPEANFNTALIQMAAVEAVPLADIFALAQALPDRRQLLANDGVHWASGGFPIPAEAWRRALARVEFVLLDAP